MFNKEIYITRRNKLKKSVGSGLIVFPGNEDSGMNYKDNIYHFRQDSTFLYFTGIDIPCLCFIIDVDNNNETLFGNDLTIEEMVWTGPVQELSMFADKAGIANVKSLSLIEQTVKVGLQKNQAIHFILPYRAETALKLSEWLTIPYKSLQQQSSVKLIESIIAQRSYKSTEEISEIEKAIDITTAMQLKAIQLSQQGMKEYEIAGQLEGIAVSSGGHLSFPTILTVNGQYLHNHAGMNELRNGKMVLCDCGAETAMHYSGDMTRTFPVGKKFTTQQKEVYDIVLHAQQSAIAALKPGDLFMNVHFIACNKLAEGLKQLGLMKGDTEEAVWLGAHTLFFQCGLGHMMGLDVHDMENLGEEYVGYTKIFKKSKEFGIKSLRLGKALEEGFVLTIEPGIYIIPELVKQWHSEKRFIDFINYEKIDSAFKNFGGIRIEDDFLITSTGSSLLGKPFAKSTDEIESLKA